MVSFTLIDLNPDLAKETMTGRLHKSNSYDPAARLLTLIGWCCEVIVTSLRGVEQSLETIDIVFCIVSHVEATEETHCIGLDKQNFERKK